EVRRGGAWTGTASDFSLPERSLLSSESTRKRLPAGRLRAASAASGRPEATGGSASPRSVPCSAASRRQRRTARLPRHRWPGPPAGSGSPPPGTLLAGAPFFGQVPLDPPPQPFVPITPPALAVFQFLLGDRLLDQTGVLRVGREDFHVGIPHHLAVGVYGRL